MTLRTQAKKSAVALALVAPLALAACGTSEEDTDAAGTVTATSTKAASEESSEAPTSSEEPTSTKPDESEQAKPEANKNEAAGAGAGAGGADAAAESGSEQAPEQLANPFEGNQDPLKAKPVAPIEGGQAADPAATDEINQLVGGLYETQTLRQFLRYVPDHTCGEVMAQQGELQNMDYNQIPDMPLSDVPNAQWDQAGVKSVEDLQVKGDTASATVTVNTPEGEDSSVMRFKQENGAWTFCN